MDREIAKEIFAASERALAALTDAEQAICHITDEAERKPLLRALSDVIADVLTGIRVTALRQYPDLEPAQELSLPDRDLTFEQQALVSKLSSTELELIDGTLLSECASSWRKVARVVGATMSAVQGHLPGLPDVYYGARLAELVQQGQLEAQGDLRRMRFSEVRRPH
jgi:Protein of unknown function